MPGGFSDGLRTRRKKRGSGMISAAGLCNRGTLAPSPVVITQPTANVASTSDSLAAGVLGAAVLSSTVTAAVIGGTSSTSGAGAITSASSGALAANVTTSAAVSAVTSAASSCCVMDEEATGNLVCGLVVVGGVMCALQQVYKSFFGKSPSEDEDLVSVIASDFGSDSVQSTLISSDEISGGSSERVELTVLSGGSQGIPLLNNIQGEDLSCSLGSLTSSSIYSLLLECGSDESTLVGESGEGSSPSLEWDSYYGTPNGSLGAQSLYCTPPMTPVGDGFRETMVTQPDGGGRQSVREAFFGATGGGGEESPVIGSGGKHKAKLKHLEQTR